MPDYSWKQVKSKMSMEVEEIHKSVSDYDYSNKASAVATDEKICNMLVLSLRKAKNKLFDIINYCFETHQDGIMNYMEIIRDDIDIFSDEIKVRYAEWGLNQEFLEKLIRHDFELLTNLKKLNSMLDYFYKKILETDLEAERKMFEKKSGEVKKLIVNLVRTFKAREAICNIREISLEKTFERIKKDLEEKI
jgi:hypothetical protein